MYCAYCGNKLADNARFCAYCGKQTSSPAPVRTVQPAAPAPAVQAAAPVSIVPQGKNIRYKCSCGAVLDTVEGAACSKCGKPQIEGCGYYKLYRMGSPIGVANGFGIYIDGEPYGHIGNKQTCWIRLPYGRHNIHIALGMNRRCTDQQFELSPEHPLECGKVHMKMGAFSNTFVIEPAANSETPD